MRGKRPLRRRKTHGFFIKTDKNRSLKKSPLKTVKSRKKTQKTRIKRKLRQIKRKLRVNSRNTLTNFAIFFVEFVL